MAQIAETGTTIDFPEGAALRYAGDELQRVVSPDGEMLWQRSLADIEEAARVDEAAYVPQPAREDGPPPGHADHRGFWTQRGSWHCYSCQGRINMAGARARGTIVGNGITPKNRREDGELAPSRALHVRDHTPRNVTNTQTIDIPDGALSLPSGVVYNTPPESPTWASLAELHQQHAGPKQLPGPTADALRSLIDMASFQAARADEKVLQDFFQGYLAGASATLGILLGALGYEGISRHENPQES